MLKNFGATLLIWIIITCTVTFFFGAYLFIGQHIYRTAVLIAVLLAVITHIFQEQSQKIHDLEERLKELEEKINA